MIHGGSDSPVESILPLEALEAAIKRRDGKGGTFMPEECLTLTEAIKLFSLGVAQGVKWEDKLGELKPGQFADFNIITGDLQGDSVKDFVIHSSFVNGNRVL